MREKERDTGGGCGLWVVWILWILAKMFQCKGKYIMSVFERDRWQLKLGVGVEGMGYLDTMVSYITVSM